MITGAHAIIYSQQADDVRALFRDTLGFNSIDAGDGWLIFGLPSAEVAMHPAEGSSHHELYLLCDDINATVQELMAKGVEFSKPISDESWGLLTAIRLPGGGELGIYEPRHPVAAQDRHIAPELSGGLTGVQRRATRAGTGPSPA